MKSIKQQLKTYLINNGRSEKLVDIYNKFPYQGHNLTNKQKGDRVRSVWRKLKRNDFKKNPRVLVFDLETSPLRAYVWSIWKQNVNPTNGHLRSQKMILSWSAKWLYGDNVMNDALTPDEILSEDDSRITKSLWKLIDEADVLIAHNGIGYDVKTFNTRCLLHDLPPTSHYQVIDTLLHARKRFKLESNKLDYLGQILGFGKKLPTSFSLWDRCMQGDEEAMKYMVKYCDQDVILLEAIYLKMRPWIKPHPNFNLIIGQMEDKACPSCGSKDVKDNGVYRTYANVYQAHKCGCCSSTFRSRKAVKLDKTNLTIATPN